MKDLHGSLQAMSERGTPIGSRAIRDRVALDLAGGSSRFVPELNQRWRLPGPVMAVIAAVAVVLLFGGVVLLINQGDGGTVSSDSPASGPPPASTATTAPASTTTAPPTTTSPSVTTPESWRRVGAEAMEPAVAILDLAAVGPGLVAVGVDVGEDFRQDGVIFASEDGVTWTRLAEDDPVLTTGMVVPLGISQTERGLIAVGTSCEDDAFPCESGPYPTVWTSAEGTSWTRSTIAADLGSIEDLVVTEHGIVAAGWTETPVGGSTDGAAVSIRPAVWLAPDGVDWTLVWEGDPVVTEGPVEVNRILGLATGPDGLVVGVGSVENELGEEIAAVWISDDGRTWEQVDPEGSAGEAGLAVSMVDVASGTGGFVAVGNEGAAEIAVWQSPDGRSWTRVDLSGQPAGTGALGAVAALDSGWVAAGSGPGVFGEGPVSLWPGVFGEGPVSLWASPDGSVWDRMTTLDTGYAQAIVVTDNGILMSGGIFENDDFHGAVWMGPR